MADMKKRAPQMQPRFNFMWFWLVVGVAIIGYSMLSDNSEEPVRVDGTYVNALVEKGYVTKINVLDREQGSVYLTQSGADSLRQYREFAAMPTSGAQLKFNTGGDVADFREQSAPSR